MSWLAVGAMAVGTGMTVGGGIMDRNSALSNAQAQAAARNASLKKNIGILDQFGADNRGVFDANMGHYDPTTQAAALDAAQTNRGNSNAAAISPSDTNQPIQSDASPATRSDLAKRMLVLHDASTARAKAMGKLGGYSDQWVANELADKQASRDIGVANNYAEGRKSLVGPEGDLAAAAAYKPPSIWGALLKGAGSVLSSAGGAGIGGGGGFSNPFGVNDMYAAGQPGAIIPQVNGGIGHA